MNTEVPQEQSQAGGQSPTQIPPDVPAVIEGFNPQTGGWMLQVQMPPIELSEHPSAEFHKIFDGVLPALRNFTVSTPDVKALEPLREILQDPENRMLALSHLQQSRLHDFRHEEQAEAILYALSEHVSESPIQLMHFYAETLSLMHGNAPYQQFVGELFLEHKPPAGFVHPAVEFFCQENCYNLEKLPHLKPWIEYLSETAYDSQVGMIAQELAHRLQQNHLSSYDHLLEVLTRSNSPVASQSLHGLLGLSQEQALGLSPETEGMPGMVPPEPSFLTEMQVNAVTYFAVFTGIGMLLGGHDFSLGHFGIDMAIAQTAGFLMTRFRRSKQSAMEEEIGEAMQEIAQSPVMSQFGERVYEQMQERAAQNDKFAASLVQSIRSSSLYKALIPRWDGEEIDGEGA